MNKPIALILLLLLFSPLFAKQAEAADPCANFYQYEMLQCDNYYPDMDSQEYKDCMSQAAQDFIDCKGTTNPPNCVWNIDGYLFCGYVLLRPDLHLSGKAPIVLASLQPVQRRLSLYYAANQNELTSLWRRNSSLLSVS